LIINPYHERGADSFFLKARGFDFSAPVEPIDWVTMYYTSNTNLFVM